jgi:ABC-type multidrug transport system ATPase subunit
MNVLMGKVDKTEGTFWVNGVKQEMKEYKRIIGYVPQDDIVLPELTVRENILHSARCRLPSSWSDTEIQAHVDLVISCLSLTHVQHSLVGDAVRPVLSGGQRKRVNIGVELAAAPMCLFCDEPTSGLDSTSALAVLKLLQALSRLGVTVVSVIHQPSIEIYECLDNLLLISAGHAIFQGPREEMVRFLKSEGFAFKPSSNPADIVMDIISGQGAKHRSFARENEVAHLISRWDVVQPTFNPRPAGDSTALNRTVKNRGGAWYKQMVFCFMRSMIQQQRQISSFFLEITVGAIAGALIGLAVTGADGHLFQGIYRYPYEVLSISTNYGLLPQIGLIGGLAIGLAGSPSGVKVFGEESK